MAPHFPLCPKCKEGTLLFRYLIPRFTDRPGVYVMECDKCNKVSMFKDDDEGTARVMPLGAR